MVTPASGGDWEHAGAPSRREVSVYLIKTPCSDFYKIPEELRCVWVSENDNCFEGTTIIQYVPFLFCNFTSQTLFIGILILLLLLIGMFIVLGTVADEFFCPNLEVIAKVLNLSEATAGVTILAFGNGSPDIFTSLAGVPRGHIELVFCELIGGGIFITTVLVGTICLFYPINVVGRILIRDVCFYLVSLLWTYYTFNKEYVTAYDTAGYILIYGVYLLVVIFDKRFRRSFIARASQLIPESDLERLRAIHAGSVREASKERGLAHPETDSDDKSIKKKPSSMKKPKPQRTPQKRTKGNKFDEQEKDKAEAKKKAKKSQPLSFFQTCCKSKTEDETTQPLLDNEIRTPGEDDLKSMGSILEKPNEMKPTEPESEEPTNLEADRSIRFELDQQGHEKHPHPQSLWGGFKETINPLEIEHWETASCFSKLYAIIKSPAVLFLKLTVPVVTIHKPMWGWCKLLSVLLCITFPLYTISASGYAAFPVTKREIPLILFFLAIGKLFSVIVFITSSTDKSPPYHIAFAFLGFLGSVFTVFTVASEVVNLMWAVGVVVGISEATLGLTVLSWGTQIGDFISILALVRAGYEKMGFVACFGGSLFNVIMSIGLSFTVAAMSSEDRRLSVHYGPMGLVCLIVLAISLVSSFVAFPLMRFRTRNPFGWYLYALYGVFLGICVLNEFHVITLPGMEVVETVPATAVPHKLEDFSTEKVLVWKNH